MHIRNGYGLRQFWRKLQKIKICSCGFTIVWSMKAVKEVVIEYCEFREG